MKKKTLVSVLAMTSASMAAYANANLDQIKTEVDQWVGAEKPSLVNGVLTSPNGTTISQSLGSLLPGTYKLSATTLMNAKFLVNGKALTNGEFKVEGTAASEVTLPLRLSRRERNSGLAVSSWNWYSILPEHNGHCLMQQLRRLLQK